jgi:hypothetical protein
VDTSPAGGTASIFRERGPRVESAVFIAAAILLFAICVLKHTPQSPPAAP